MIYIAIRNILNNLNYFVFPVFKELQRIAGTNQCYVGLTPIINSAPSIKEELSQFRFIGSTQGHLTVSSLFSIETYNKEMCMKLVWGIILVILALGLFGSAIAVGIAWIGFCFGTVIIGVLLLLFAPTVLLLPFAFLWALAQATLLGGLALIATFFNG